MGKVFTPDDGHIVARNIYRKLIDMLRKFVHHVGSTYKNYTRMHCQQNINVIIATENVMLRKHIIIKN
jgi:hypothetical protein